MIIHSIREIPPDVDPQTALRVLGYAKEQLMKDPARCLTATGKINNLMMVYEAKQ